MIRAGFIERESQKGHPFVHTTDGSGVEERKKVSTENSDGEHEKIEEGASNVEIEQKEEQTDQEQDGPTIDAGARKPRERVQNIVWNCFEAGFFPRNVERPKGDIT
jgi:hypothetical protein